MQGGACDEKVRDGEDTIANTRGAYAPTRLRSPRRPPLQNRRRHACHHSTSACCSLAQFVRSATVEISMAEPSNFVPDEATVIISDYSLGRSETLKKFHSHVLPLSGEKA